MDLMIDVLNKLLSERDIKSWNCHQSDQIVFTVKFQLTNEEIRHLENLGIQSVVGNIGSDSRKVVTYKKKSNYQIDRDAKRSYGLIRSYNANSRSQPKQDKKSPNISPSVGARSHDSSVSSRDGNSPIRSSACPKSKQCETKHPVKPKAMSSPKPSPTKKMSSEPNPTESSHSRELTAPASSTEKIIEDQYVECLEEATELKSQESIVADIYAECLKLKSACYSRCYSPKPD